MAAQANGASTRHAHPVQKTIQRHAGMSFDTPKTLRPQVLERIVFILAGPPNKGFTHGHERRWSEGGIVSFNLATGRYINHERCSFGGLLEFIQDFTRLRSERGAAAWLARRLIGGVQ